MTNILYYPYINLPKTEWTLRTLLYYDNVGSIVPLDYYYEPKKFSKYMSDLINCELVSPINPMDFIDVIPNCADYFLNYIQGDQVRYGNLRESFYISKSIPGNTNVGLAKVHSQKFDDTLFYHLTQLGLANYWQNGFYLVESFTASSLMLFLALIIAEKTDRLPVTDTIYLRDNLNDSIDEKRRIVLEKLIPYPEYIDLKLLIKFKGKHSDLLSSFRNRIEQIAYDPLLIKGSTQFKLKIDELKQNKEELAERMKESKFGDIVLGTAVGILTANLAEPENVILTGTTSFLYAVYSAIKCQNINNIVDHSGMKYLALAEKKKILRQSSTLKNYGTRRRAL